MPFGCKNRSSKQLEVGKEEGSSQNRVIKTAGKVCDVQRYLQGIAATSAPISSLEMLPTSAGFFSTSLY